MFHNNVSILKSLITVAVETGPVIWTASIRKPMKCSITNMKINVINECAVYHLSHIRYHRYTFLLYIWNIWIHSAFSSADKAVWYCNAYRTLQKKRSVDRRGEYSERAQNMTNWYQRHCNGFAEETTSQLITKRTETSTFCNIPSPCSDGHSYERVGGISNTECYLWAPSHYVS